jgi:hypothetical protein
MLRRASLSVLTVLIAALAAVPVASARTSVAVGIADQQPLMFDQASYKALKVKKTRYLIPWDAAKKPTELAKADSFVTGARSAGVRVLLHISTNKITSTHAHLPSTREYKTWVGRLVRRYKAKGVKDWGVWNEANHRSQPTSRSPKRAAQYFPIMRSLCRGCTIVALDVLDQKGVASYISKFYRALSRTNRSRARLVGIHNYSDTNRKRSTGTRRIISAVHKYNRRSQFWLTETGGVVNFGRAFKCSQSRAASRLSYMFTLARKYRHSVKRLYIYNWTGSGCNGFDAGLTNPDGSPRPGYTVVKKKLAGFIR